MSKKSPFRGLLDNWHGKQAETLFKAEQQKLYHIIDAGEWMEFRLKNSLSVIGKILRLFVNPLTVDGRYCVLNRGNLL